MQKLAAAPHEKVWGSPYTEPWFANPESLRIGEIWFGASERFPLLVKLLFTSDRLSVQVHPEDGYARIHENSRGKTEMWHILRAEPEARVALGLRERITEERLRETALSGEIEDLLNWVPAKVGDTFFVPAGTIHAIGGGLVLCEVQQLSDVTYRLFDYGRPRELHLKKAVEVASLDLYQGIDLSTQVIECGYFRTEYLSVRGTARCPAREKNTLWVALEGEGLIGGDPFHPGKAWEVTGSSGDFEIESESARFLVTSEP